MKAVNAAFDFLMVNIDKINSFQSTDEKAHYNYGDDMESVLNVLTGLSGLVYEVIGNWIWISGETRDHKDTLKEIGCKWAAKKNSGFTVLKNIRAAGTAKNTVLMKSARCTAQPGSVKQLAGKSRKQSIVKTGRKPQHFEGEFMKSFFCSIGLF